MRKALIITVVALLAVVLAAPSSSAMTSPISGLASKQTTVVTPTGLQTGDPVVATGRVISGVGVLKGYEAYITDMEGAQPVADTAVRLVWIPAIDAAQVGDAIDPVVVAATTADASGSYSLSATPDAAMLAEAAANGGWLNFDVEITTPAGEQRSMVIPRFWDGTQWADREGQGPGTPDVIQLVHGTTGALFNGSESSGEAAALDYAYGCQWVVVSTTRNSTRIGRWHTSSNANSNWVYGQRADSTIDTGFKPAYGPWHVNGSVHIGNDKGSSAEIGGSKTISYAAYTRTDFRYQTMKVRDYFGKPFGTQCYGSSYRVGDQILRSTSWAGSVAYDQGSGSANIGCDQEPQLSYRGSYPPGTYLHIMSTTASKVGFAVDVGPINFGARSGYSTYVEFRWDSKRGKGVWLCGTTGDEAAAPGIIYSQNKK